MRTATGFAAAGLLTALLASVFLSFANVYSSQSCEADAGQEPECTTTSTTLAEENGRSVLLILALPIGLATASLIAVTYRLSKWLSWAAAGVTLAASTVAIASLGAFFLPTAALLICAAATDSRGGGDDSVTSTNVGRSYNHWIKKSVTGRLYGLLASPPGLMLINTPAFNLHTELQLQPETRLLDIGCGSGALIELLASRVRFKTPPVGIDLSASMLGLSAPKRVSLVEGSGVQLPFADESFDVITSAHVAKHLDDASLLAMLAEIRRVLSFGGIAVLWDFAPTRSRLLNRWNEFVLTQGVRECNLRNYTTLSAYALEAGFEWVSNAHLRPFIYPPIPRVSLILGKAPVGWREEPQSAQGASSTACAL